VRYGLIEHPLECCVARVWCGRDTSVSGAAFLILDNLLCTCTHVIQGKGRAPLKKVWVNFPFLSDTKIRATPVRYLPVEENGGDIAFLSLAEVPEGALALRTFESRFATGTLCDTYGFPKGFERGIPASVVIGNRNGLGWRNLTTIVEHGVVVEGGFSGAPVWDVVRQCIVGMIVAVHKKSLVSFAIPSEALARVCPELLLLGDTISGGNENRICPHSTDYTTPANCSV
jgi:hypothetical protein